MKPYADSGPRFVAQLAADAAVLCSVLLFVWLGTVVHDGIEELAAPGDGIAASADDLAGSLADAGDRLGGAPIVGDEVAAPFDAASDASSAMGDAGRSTAEAARRLAFWSGVLVAAVPILLVLRRYLPWRLRFLLEADAAERVLRSGAGPEVFAWRAVTTAPLRKVAAVSDDPLGALRRGDPDVVRRLAALELDRIGVSSVPRPQTPAGSTARA